MKATMDIPDDLYRRVKAKSALEGRAVREVAVQLFQSWLEHADVPAEMTKDTAVKAVPSWFSGAREYARRVPQHDMAAVRSSIARGRARESAGPVRGNRTP